MDFDEIFVSDWHSPRNSRLDFGGDLGHSPGPGFLCLNHDPDPGMFLKDSLFTIAVLENKT